MLQDRLRDEGLPSCCGCEPQEFIISRMRYIVGIDEVGRGALAGPVVVAAVIVPKGLRLAHRSLGKLRDSKKLRPERRERWHDFARGHGKIRFALGRVYPRGIERLNISRAANLAALRAFSHLIANEGVSIRSCSIYLDGGLYLGNTGGNFPAKTIVRGDEKIPAIALASIVAKVTRDRAMAELAKRHVRYGFEVHKGYGTKSHRAALKKYGPSEAHRLTYLGFLENFKPKTKKLS